MFYLRVSHKNVIIFINYIDWSTRSDRRRWWWYRTELTVGPFEKTRSLFFRTALVEFYRFCPEKPLQKQITARRFCMFLHGKRFSARKSAFHHNAATNDRCSLCGEKTCLFWWGIDMGGKSQFRNCDKKSQLWLFVTFVNSDPYLCLTKISKFCPP